MARNANIALRSLRNFYNSRIDLVVVLIDREKLPDCPGDIAQGLVQEVNRLAREERLNLAVAVVVKDRSYENWLLADLNALRQLPARFRVTRRMRQSIEPDKADHLANPLTVLKDAILNRQEYNKRQDAKAIAEKLVPENAARHSRSFRRLLRIIGHPHYTHQSRMPAV